MKPIEEIYSQREMASHIAAQRIERAVNRRLAGAERAAIVVSGGSTPRRCLEVLADKPLAWDRVHVTLSDERWVLPTDADSNQRMITETLLAGRAAESTLLPLYQDGIDHGQACAELESSLRALPLPFACCLLGMGTDGHFASLFPDLEGLDATLDPEGDRYCVPVATAASPHPRVSLTLAALARSVEIVLLIFGREKRRVYQAARDGEADLPVAALLRQSRAPVRLIWAP